MYQNYANIDGKPKLIQAFVGPVYDTGSNTDWRIWTKPENISLVMIIAIGGGGGGGRGYSSTTTTQSAGGGGGGAGGSVFKTIIPADILPQTLYVKPGNGGYGAKQGRNPSTGGGSYVALSPNTNFNGVGFLVTCGGGSAGSNGTATAGGSFGAAPTLAAYNNTDTRWAGIGYISGSPPATAGSLATNAVSVNLISPSAWNISIHNTGGAGGGGVDNSIPPPVAYNGGSINLPPSLLSSLNVSYANNTIPGGAGGSFGVNGENGLNYGLNLTNNLNILYPLIFTGGAGGGAAVSGTGYPAGNGGHGGIGSGGGGGGGSLPRTAGTAGPPGDGGDGGPGLVLFVCG